MRVVVAVLFAWHATPSPKRQFGSMHQHETSGHRGRWSKEPTGRIFFFWCSAWPRTCILYLCSRRVGIVVPGRSAVIRPRKAGAAILL
jgi:hypothetical protein